MSGHGEDTAPERPQAAAPAVLPRGTSEDERLLGLVVQALILDAGEAPTGERLAGFRKEAARMLTDHSFRTLHNHVLDIRRDAVNEFLMSASRRPSPWPTFLACGAALLASGVLNLWLLGDPARLAVLVGVLSR